VSILEKLKAEAAALEAEARAEGNPIKHAAALDQVAKSRGFNGWRALRASLPVPDDGPMKRYRSADWGFAIDIPKRWNVFPAVPTNSPYEVIRFASKEEGDHLLIVFRAPYDPKVALEDYLDGLIQPLGKAGFGNFTAGIGSVPTLDFDKPRDGDIWSVRQYFVLAGTLAYTLGFGTNRRAEMIELFDRMATSFAIEESARPASRR
jgi:hypothetical protein